MFRGSRSLLALLALLAVASAVHAGSADDPEILDPADDVAEDPDQPLTDYGAIEIVKVWLEEENPTHFVFIADMGAAIEPSATPAQQFTYILRATYQDQGLSMPATATDEGDGLVLTGATIHPDDDSWLIFNVGRTSWSGVRAGGELTNLAFETDGWTVTPTFSASDDATGSRSYTIGTQAIEGMDTDGDGIDDRDEFAFGSDPSRPDTDLDGLNDGEEQAAGTDPNDPDTDGDGLLDGDEVDAGSDPNDPDSDNDGLNDGDEIAAGTDPNNPDSDGDGLNDGDEIDAGANPLVADTDGDGATDGEEAAAGSDPTDRDSDDDGLTDGEELANGFDPTDPNDADQDADGDGVSNLDEIVAGTNPNVSDKNAVEKALPGNLPSWLWILILLVVIAIVAFLVIFLVRRRDFQDGQVIDEEAVPEDEHEVIEVEEDAPRRDAYKPFVINEDYLMDGLEPEQVERARRLFEERERRYLDTKYPGRDRSFDEEEFAAIWGPVDEKQQAKLAREGAKARKQAERDAAKQAKAEAKAQKQAEKAAAKAAKKGN